DSFGVELTVKSNYGEQDSNKKNVKVNDVSHGGGGGCSQEPEVMAPESSSCSGYGNIQNFTISRVEDNGRYLTADRDVHLCGGHQCEVRRPHTGGYREFLGDIRNLSCRTMTMDHSHQPAYDPPHAGEK